MYQFPQPELSNPPQETNTQSIYLDIEQCPEALPVDAVRDAYCGQSCFFCPDEELVFGLFDVAPGEVSHKRDYTSFLMKGSNITFELYRNGNKVADLNSNALGTYYATFAAQPTYSGFLIDWSLVLQTFGTGNYVVVTKTLFGGTDYEFVSRDFRLLAYEPELAHQTVKIETYQFGNVIRSIFDYTGLLEDGWYSAVRIPGTFGSLQAELEVDDYLNTDYIAKQNQTRVIQKWFLESKLLAFKTIEELIADQILANKILITDYNLRRKNPKRRFEVRPSGFPEFSNPNERYIKTRIEFVDVRQNIIKRNF